jgi:hypothetical protein
MTIQAHGIVIAPTYSCTQPHTKEKGKDSPKDNTALHPSFSPHHAGAPLGMRKGKNPSFRLRFSLSTFSKAHSTADLISSKSTGFIA